ncbi:MAG: LPXTG cell wall anchor domain-containing protein, partial [Sphingomonas sp.]
MQAPSIVNGGNSGIAAGRSNLPWLIAAGLALLALMAGFVAWRRRRAANEELYYEEAAYEPGLMVEQPVANAGDRAASDYQPQIVAPVPAFRRVAAAASPQAEAELSAADRADMDALATSSDPHANRPWLEFLMRPVRAGTSGE